MKTTKQKLRSQEIEELIGYAIKEGYLEVEDIKNWTKKQKEDYYNKCMAFELNEN